MNYSVIHKKFFFGCVLLVTVLSSCKKLIEVPPPSYQIGSEQVFANDATATAAIVGIYSEMMNNKNQFTTSNTTLYTGMYADELNFYSPGEKDEFMASRLSQSSHAILSSIFWAPAYKYIYTANLCLERLDKSTSLTPGVKNTLTGEAKFLRAFCFFHLVNFFGEVPLTLTSDYRINAKLPRAAEQEVYKQITNDLIQAKQLLPEGYQGTEKIRPNKWAATALLARVYLYNKNWEAAEKAATEVINAGSYSLVSNPNNVFLKNSREAIWQLQPVNTNYNTWEGNEILPGTSAAPPTYVLTDNLLGAFEPTDQRREAWVASRTYLGQTIFYPFKYKVYGNNAPITEYNTVLRLAEQYLVRAEARVHQQNIGDAQSDLNMVRTRAGLPNTTANDQTSLLNAIERERRIELAFEWGHRWFDLKRWGRADSVLANLKSSTWESAHTLWPIPVNQINANPALTQNSGY